MYPIIDRTDWDHTDTWHHSGLWDVNELDEPTSRILNESYADSLLNIQEKIALTLSSMHQGVNSLVYS